MQKSALALFLTLALSCAAKADSAIYAKAFPGSDVGAKVRNAMASCTANPSVPCIIVIDPSLAATESGTLPTMCSHCYLEDYRGGPPGSTKVVAACSYSGATADVQLSAALARIPNGGIVDARCYGESWQTIAATVTVGVTRSSDTSQTILFDPSTKFSPASASLNMFHVVGAGKLDGLNAVLLPRYLYSGAVVYFDSEPGYIDDNIQNVKCDADNEISFDNSAGYCVELHGSSAGGAVAFVHGGHIRCIGLSACLFLYDDGAAYVNGNSFHDVSALNSGAVILLDANTRGGGTGVLGNRFSDISGESIAHACIEYQGTNRIQNNVFTGVKCWDSQGVSNPALSLNNLTIGSFDNGYTDPTAAPAYAPNQNVYYDSSNMNNGWSYSNFRGVTIRSLPGNQAIEINPSSDSATQREIYATNAAKSAYVWWIENSGDATLNSLSNNHGTLLPSTLLGQAGPSNGYLSTSISGTVTLVSGTAAVSTSAACATGKNCNYSLARCAVNSSTAIGNLSVGTITPGASFIVNSLSSTNTAVTGDASTVCWQIN